MFVRVGQCVAVAVAVFTYSCHSARALSQLLRCCVPATEVTAYSIRQVRRNSGPMARALLLHCCKTSSCLSNMLKPKEAGTCRDIFKTDKGNFGFSFPSRAHVVKVTNLNVTGSEALISYASEVPWRFKRHNVRSRSTMIHLRFPRLSKCQESTVHDMDCDDSFGGYNRSDGIGCTKCDRSLVFVKNFTKKTITSRSALQHCVPCPDGARICTATAIEMLPGCLVRKGCGAKELCIVFIRLLFKIPKLRQI